MDSATNRSKTAALPPKHHKRFLRQEIVGAGGRFVFVLRGWRTLPAAILAATLGLASVSTASQEPAGQSVQAAFGTARGGPASEPASADWTGEPMIGVVMIATVIASMVSGMLLASWLRRSRMPAGAPRPGANRASRTKASADGTSLASELTPSAAAKEPLALPDGCIETKILYIHNDPRGFKALEKELRRYCIDLIEMRDADTAYMACFNENPKLILVDSALPDTTPSAVVARLSEHPLAATILTVVVIDGKSHELAHEYRSLDGQRCLSKPVNVEELLNELTHSTALCERAPGCTNQWKRYAKRADAAHHTSLEPAQTGAGTNTEPLTAEGSRPPWRDGEPEEGTAARRRPKVLCIDDDPHVSQAIMMRLRPLGVDVIRAFDGMQGFWTGLDTRPDVIITDLRMPDGEGTYIFGRFQAHPLTKDVPVIVLTGETNPAVRRTMLSLGVAAYFTKPWNFDELRQELERHIDLHPVDTEAGLAVPT